MSHAASVHRGGRPRLVFSAGDTAPIDGDAAAGVQQEFDLLPDRTEIGSGASADLRLAGLGDPHAEVRPDAAGDYVYRQLGPTGGSRINGQPVREAVLHTGDRIELGPWRLSFLRDEHAEHAADRRGGPIRQPGTRRG